MRRIVNISMCRALTGDLLVQRCYGMKSPTPESGVTPDIPRICRSGCGRLHRGHPTGLATALLIGVCVGLSPAPSGTDFHSATYLDSTLHDAAPCRWLGSDCLRTVAASKSCCERLDASVSEYRGHSPCTMQLRGGRDATPDNGSGEGSLTKAPESSRRRHVRQRIANSRSLDARAKAGQQKDHRKEAGIEKDFTVALDGDSEEPSPLYSPQVHSISMVEKGGDKNALGRKTLPRTVIQKGIVRTPASDDTGSARNSMDSFREQQGRRPTKVIREQAILREYREQAARVASTTTVHLSNLPRNATEEDIAVALSVPLANVRVTPTQFSVCETAGEFSDHAPRAQLPRAKADVRPRGGRSRRRELRVGEAKGFAFVTLEGKLPEATLLVSCDLGATLEVERSASFAFHVLSQALVSQVTRWMIANRSCSSCRRACIGWKTDAGRKVSKLPQHACSFYRKVRVYAPAGRCTSVHQRAQIIAIPFFYR